MQNKLWRKYLPIGRCAPELQPLQADYKLIAVPNLIFCFEFQSEKEAFEEAEKVRKAREEEVISQTTFS